MSPRRKLMAIQWASLTALLAVSVAISPSGAIQFKVKIEHDMSKPTYGLLGQSSSQLSYDSRNGLKLKGTIKDVLGPPIKVAKGVKNILKGSGMGGLGDVGASMRSNGAILGVDVARLEANGGTSLLRGGLLRSISKSSDVANLVRRLPGQRMSSVIELPVKVVSLKDLAGGQSTAKDSATRGEALRRQGMNQVIEGASEGVQNLNNMVQKATGDAASAFRLLPVIIDMQREEYEQEQKEKNEKQAKVENKSSATHQQLSDTPNPLLGGLNSLLNHNGPQQAGFHDSQNHYAAMLNADNPLTGLLMNPELNPILTPISEGPLAQSLADKLSVPSPQQVPNPNNIGHSITTRYRPFPDVQRTEPGNTSVGSTTTRRPSYRRKSN